MTFHQKKTGVLTTIFVATVLMSVCRDGAMASAQVPGLPGSLPATKVGTSDDASAKSVQGKPWAAVATSSEPITVDQRVSDNVSSLLIIGGVLLALGALGLTHIVMSILGVASILGLAVGFAFRDITENFIASVLLGVRRPFQIGDYVTIAGQSGVVKSLNTRATVLVTLEGNHVRIPNATIFKEIMVNATASPSFRHSFDVLIPHDAPTIDAINAINIALSDQQGILKDPRPRALVEALEPGGVRIRAYFWSATRGVDWFQLRSDANLMAKVGLQRAGVLGPAVAASRDTVDSPPRIVPNDKPRLTIRVDQAARELRHDAVDQASVSPRRDSRATVSVTPVTGDGCATPMEQALEQPETRVSDEGANLLKGNRPE